MIRLLCLFSVALQTLAATTIAEDCVDSRCETRTASASRSKPGDLACEESDPPKRYLKVTWTDHLTRGGWYDLDETITDVYQFDKSGNYTIHNEGQYSVNAPAVNSNSPCENGWSDGVYDSDPAQCTDVVLTDSQLIQLSEARADAMEWFTNDPEGGAEAYPILDGIDVCTNGVYHYMFHFKRSSDGLEEKEDITRKVEDEYLTETLIQDLNIDFWEAVEGLNANSAWNGNSNSADGHLEPSQLSAWGRALQYRFRVLGTAGTPYRVKWQPITIFTNGAAPLFGPIQEETVYGNGSTNYSRVHVELPVMDELDSTNNADQTFIIYYGAQNIQYQCNPCFLKKGPPPSPGNANVDLSFGGAWFSASMGNGFTGKSAGEITFAGRHSHSLSISNIVDPRRLEFTDSEHISQVLYHTNGFMTQIKAPQCLAQITEHGDYNFSIDFYSPDNVGPLSGGLYTLSGAPYVS